MKFNICVPIPIKSANILELKSIIAESLRSDPNLIELRYDYIDDVQQITQDFVNELLANVQPKIPVIFTFRNHKEGGKMKIDDKIRFEILKTLVLSHPNYLDIEMNTEKRNLGEIINNAIKNKVKLIFSYHNFEKTPPYKDALSLIKSLKNKLINEFSPNLNNLQDIIYKFIFTAQRFEDNLVPLKICKYFKEKNQKIISFCMGELGIFSRIMCTLAGSFLTYASFEEKTALGQLNIKKMREIYNLIMNFI